MGLATHIVCTLLEDDTKDDIEHMFGGDMPPIPGVKLSSINRGQTWEHVIWIKNWEIYDHAGSGMVLMASMKIKKNPKDPTLWYLSFEATIPVDGYSNKPPITRYFGRSLTDEQLQQYNRGMDRVEAAAREMIYGSQLNKILDREVMSLPCSWPQIGS